MRSELCRRAIALRPLEFAESPQVISCTPSAVDLALVGLAAANFSYYAGVAACHHGHFAATENLHRQAAAWSETLGVDELLSARTTVIGRARGLRPA